MKTVSGLVFGIIVVLWICQLPADETPNEEAHGMECTLAVGPYDGNEHGVYVLPEGLTWNVMARYSGRTATGEQFVDERITLVLQDAENRLWPVIVKMSIDEVESLRDDLDEMIDRRRVLDSVDN